MGERVAEVAVLDGVEDVGSSGTQSASGELEAGRGAGAFTATTVGDAGT
jgi:hypothetical protein